MFLNDSAPATGCPITFVIFPRRHFSVEALSCVTINPKRLSMSILHSSSDERPLINSRSDSQIAVTVGATKPTASPAALAVFSANLGGEFTACNFAFTKLLGYAPEEIMGRHFSALFDRTQASSRNDSSQLGREIVTAASAQDDYDGRLFARPKSGNSFPVQVRN